MSDRERKRAERQKRKRRSAERVGAPNGDGDAAAAAAATAEAPPTETESFQEKMSRRYEERNAEAREKLQPLDKGERPRAVLVGAVVSAIFAAIFTASAVIAATDSIEVSGRKPSAAGIAIFAAALWLMTWGMWKARYWAVLGFQVLLLMVLVLTSLGLVAVSTIPQLIADLLLLAGSGTLFYFMVRAMARIQMPTSPGAD